jgi:hypothetical protein
MRRFSRKALLIFVVVIISATTTPAKVHISEVLYNPSDDTIPAFIEFYNSSDTNVTLEGWQTEVYCDNKEIIQFPADSVIPSYGFFLIGFIADTHSWAEFSYTPDYYADYEFGADLPGGIILYNNSGENIDALGWGLPPEGYYEGEPFVLVNEGSSIERKSGPNHNELRGNSYDTDNNLNDCRERTEPQPQNINSPREQPSLNAEQQSIGYIKAMYDYQ